MKRTVRIAAALLALELALALTACMGKTETEENTSGDEEAVRDLIAEFESSCRALDIDGVLKTLDPKIQKTIQKIGDLAGKLTGTENAITFENIASALAPEGANIDGEALDGALGGLETEITQVTLDGAKATAKVTANASVGGKNVSVKLDINCKKTDGEWYISGIKTDNTENNG